MKVENIKNKGPISPFLTVYRPQYTSMFSILQRVSGIILTLCLYLYLLIVKLSKISLSYYFMYNIIYFVLQGNVFLSFELAVIIFLLVVFFYHFYFGLRYLYWDSIGGGRDKDYFVIDLVSVKKTNVQLVFWVVLSVLFVTLQVILFNVDYVYTDSYLPVNIVQGLKFYNFIIFTPVFIGWLMYWFIWMAKTLR